MSFSGKRAFVYIAWGERYLTEASKSAASVRMLYDSDIILLTDKPITELLTDKPITDAFQFAFTVVIIVNFEFQNLCRKSEIFKYLPQDYDSFCYLDTDTFLLMDVDHAFEKAEQFGIAAAPAPHYCLEHFWNFGSELNRHKFVCKGIMQYNTGVIFFSKLNGVFAVLENWYDLCKETALEIYEQPYFSLSLEILKFNPYTLSINYNYRNFGDGISGDVRIWHSHLPLPDDVNYYLAPWPPRRFLDSRRIEPDQMSAISIKSEVI